MTQYFWHNPPRSTTRRQWYAVSQWLRAVRRYTGMPHTIGLGVKMGDVIDRVINS